jgi:hypothetical protein
VPIADGAITLLVPIGGIRIIPYSSVCLLLACLCLLLARIYLSVMVSGLLVGSYTYCYDGCGTLVAAAFRNIVEL